MAFLFAFHAALSGAFIVAYLTGDEDTYGMHVFAGYTVLAALGLRGVAGLMAPVGSLLRFPRPSPARTADWLIRLASLDAKARGERSPLIAWMAAALLIGVTAGAVAGAVADVVPAVEDLHEALGEIALGIVIAHIVLVLALHMLKQPWGSFRRSLPLVAVMLAVAAGAALAAADDPRRVTILDSFAAQAKAADPAFTGFSAERGRALYLGPHVGGKPETNACAVCHTANPAGSGQHYKTGRTIEPMAVSANPKRFTDMAEVEKRFERDCPNVLGRDCTAEEKGDFITFLTGQ